MKNSFQFFVQKKCIFVVLVKHYDISTVLLELRFLIAKRMYDSHIVTKESKRSLRETFFHLSLKPDIIIYNCWMFRWTPTKRKLLGPGCAIINLSIRPSVCLSEVTSPGILSLPFAHSDSYFTCRVPLDDVCEVTLNQV